MEGTAGRRLAYLLPRTNRSDRHPFDRARTRVHVPFGTLEVLLKLRLTGGGQDNSAAEQVLNPFHVSQFIGLVLVVRPLVDVDLPVLLDGMRSFSALMNSNDEEHRPGEMVVRNDVAHRHAHGRVNAVLSDLNNTVQRAPLQSGTPASVAREAGS